MARRAERKHDLSLRVAKDLRHGVVGSGAEETEQRIDTASERGGEDKGDYKARRKNREPRTGRLFRDDSKAQPTPR